MTEIFPYEHTWMATDYRNGKTTTGTTRYRFISIAAPEGWTTYQGQECYEGQDGLLIEDSPARWKEEDLWGAHCERYCLDIGCYGEVGKYVCDAHESDWCGKLLEHVEFDNAEAAAAWAQHWMEDPEAAIQRANCEHGSAMG